MSILIKGMEMPTTCGNCPVHKLWAEDDEAQCMIKRALWTKYSKRNPDCPLIEIPDGHGRLIDASEKISVQMYDEQHEEWPIEEMTIDELLSQGWIDAKAPTVIPSDKDGET